MLDLGSVTIDLTTTGLETDRPRTYKACPGVDCVSALIVYITHHCLHNTSY